MAQPEKLQESDNYDAAEGTDSDAEKKESYRLSWQQACRVVHGKCHWMLSIADGEQSAEAALKTVQAGLLYLNMLSVILGRSDRVRYGLQAVLEKASLGTE